MIMKELQQRAIENSPLCVGIDLRESHLPLEIADSGADLGAKFVDYAREVVDASIEKAACFKVQIACYEAYGLKGLLAYKEILSYIRSKGGIVIADIKRGDIGSTAEMYAQGHFEGDLEADILTLNPYMGEDAITPYFSYFKKGKGAFILGKTSNPGSRDFQDLKLRDSDRKLSQEVLERIETWGQSCGKDDVFGSLGAVVGVNNIDDILEMKPYTDKLFLLVPGYGAQGAKLEDIRALINERRNGVVNVSRGLTAKLTEEKDFRGELSHRADQFAKELRTCFEK
ncbi:MAG: orotidine-5'-phosphate decarboxylase [Filifactor alocis]|nr:orotidine-5'-phosphate decarboxylase [Filifactor alocis]